MKEKCQNICIPRIKELLVNEWLTVIYITEKEIKGWRNSSKELSCTVCNITCNYFTSISFTFHSHVLWSAHLPVCLLAQLWQSTAVVSNNSWVWIPLKPEWVVYLTAMACSLLNRAWQIYTTKTKQAVIQQNNDFRVLGEVGASYGLTSLRLSPDYYNYEFKTGCQLGISMDQILTAPTKRV